MKRFLPHVKRESGDSVREGCLKILGSWKEVPRKKELEIEKSPPMHLAEVVLDSQGTDQERTLIIDAFSLNRALQGDRVQVIKDDGRFWRVTNILERASHQNIAGILQINSKIIHGATKNGVPMYLFRSSNSIYPDFYVPYKKKPGQTSKNLYAVVDLNRWEETSKLPLGMCREVIGEVGDLTSEYEHILYRHGLHYPSFKRKVIEDLAKPHLELIAQLNPDTDSTGVKSKSELDSDLLRKIGERLDLRKERVVSIDPLGCQDIDDALHVKELPDGCFQVGVHIADVGFFVEDGSPLDLMARDRLSSVYAPHRRLDMLPEVYSTNICALRSKCNRLAFSMLLTIDPRLQEAPSTLIRKVEFRKSIVHSKSSMNYEQAQQMLDGQIPTDLDLDAETDSKDLAQDLLKMRNLARKLHKVTAGGTEMNMEMNMAIDSHKLVEVFMVLTNQLVAEHLISIFPEETILRIHSDPETKDQTQTQTQTQTETSVLSNYLYLSSMKSAEYQTNSFIKSRSANTHHFGLDLDYYTHFTSPIRRYPDVLMHRLLAQASKLGTMDMGIICQNLNMLAKSLKKAERKFDRITLAQKLEQEFATSKSITEEAYVVDFEKDGHRYKVSAFFPKWDMALNFRLFSTKLDALVVYGLKDNKLSVALKNGNSVDDTNPTQLITLSLYQKIRVQIVPNLDSEQYSKKIALILI